MHVAAGRRVGRVHVGVGVDPEEADFLVLAAVELGDAGHRAGGDRVIAAEDERNFAGFERLQHQVGALGAGGGDFLEVLGVGCAFFFLLGDGDGDVAGVFDNVADGFEARFESGDADGGRTHVNAAAGLAEVERNADHADLAWGDAAERRVALRPSVSVLSSQFSVLSQYPVRTVLLRTENRELGTELGVQPMQHAREGNRFAHVLQAADPGYGSLDAHAEAGVRDAAVLAEIKIPLEGFFGQIVLVNALQEQIVGGHALRSADDFAVAFGGEHVDAEREFGALRDRAPCRTPSRWPDSDGP